MSRIDIRRVQGDELVTKWLSLVQYAFNKTPPVDHEHFRNEFLKYMDARRVFVLFRDDEPMATATVIDMVQNVRGQLYNMGGVASVATHPQARRKGFARQLLFQTFEYMADQNQAVSTLYPFRESFYGRLGYAGFMKQRIMQLKPANLAQVLKVSVEGSVEFVHIREGYDAFRQYMEHMQTKIHGLGLFPVAAEARLREKGEWWLAIARQNEEIVGVMRYRMSGFAQPMIVQAFVYRNTAGKYLLLNWLARHVDQASEIWLQMRPDDYLETWLADANIHLHSRNFDATHNWQLATPMGRVILVERLSGMRVGEGAFSVQVSDEQCEWNNGIYRFAAVDGRLQVERSTTADCTLSIQGLSALVYGVCDPGDLIFRGWGNPSLETQELMRNMFPPALPWLHAEF